MWPFTRRKKIQQTPSSPITERIAQNARNRSNVATPSSTPVDTSTSDFVLGIAGVPIPTPAGLTGFAIHSMSETSSAKASESCTPSESNYSSSSSYSDSGSSYSSSDSVPSSCGGSGD